MLRYIILLVFVLDVVSGLRILGLFPHLGASHFRFFRPIMMRLAEIGNHVTVVSHFPEKNPPPNYRDLSIGDGQELSIDLEVKMIYASIVCWKSFQMISLFIIVAGAEFFRFSAILHGRADVPNGFWLGDRRLLDCTEFNSHTNSAYRTQ